MRNMRSALEPQSARTRVWRAGAATLTQGIELSISGGYPDELFRRATEEALGRGMGPRSDKGDGDPNQDPDPPMAAPSDPTP